MPLDNYADFQAAIADKIVRTDLTTQIVDCITLFEAEASWELFRERLNEKTTILIPNASTPVTVSGAADNGSGLIRLTVDTATFTTGQEVNVNGVNGTTEANNSWIVTVIDSTHLDLQGSVFVNAYTSGGTVSALSGIAPLPSDYRAVRRATMIGDPSQEMEYVEPSILRVFYPVPLSATSGTTVGNIGVPQYFTIEGTNFIVRNIGTGNIEFDYYAATTALSSQLNWLFTGHVDCYWNGTLEQVYSYVGDHEQESLYAAKKSACYDRVKRTFFRDFVSPAVRVFGITP